LRQVMYEILENNCYYSLFLVVKGITTTNKTKKLYYKYKTQL